MKRLLALVFAACLLTFTVQAQIKRGSQDNPPKTEQTQKKKGTKTKPTKTSKTNNQQSAVEKQRRQQEEAERQRLAEEQRRQQEEAEKQRVEEQRRQQEEVERQRIAEEQRHQQEEAVKQRIIQQAVDDMVFVEGGTFKMGATKEQGKGANKDEKPTHWVTLSGYYICKYEVTQELWLAVMGSNPSKFTGDVRLPVEQVSWDDCQKFIDKLNQLTGKQFRLPSEAEWEFAARGGNKSKGYKYSGSNSIDNVAWYHDNSGKTTHPVGSKVPNELGLYDMSGNVQEWCQDWYDTYSGNSQTNPMGPTEGSHRVYRGGSIINYDWFCRVSARLCNKGTLIPNAHKGLRLAL